jgi:hypothetical protein
MHDDGSAVSRSRRLRPLARVAACASILLGSAAAHAATIVIDDADGAGQGLNDPTPVVPAGGNGATTLGAARLAVFQQAAAIWGSRLASAVPIHVTTQFTALACNSTSAVLASTGANTIHDNFPGAPLVNTWYPQALANSLAGSDLDPADADIATQFNSGIGQPSCLAGTSWYLGFDGHPGQGQIDLLTVVLHELSHGLGFQPFYDIGTGAKIQGVNDDYTLDLRQLGATPTGLDDMTDAQRVTASQSDPNLYWVGANVQARASTYSAGLVSGHVRMYAPNPEVPGSTVSHFTTAMTPNELMEPVYTGPNHDITLTLALFKDIGWATMAPAVPAVGGAWRVLLALAVLAGAARQLRRGSSRRVRGSGDAP